MQQKRQQPLTVFCIAAPEDASLLSRWKGYLLPLQEDGYLTIWPERHLADEGSHQGESLRYLLQADLLFLLVSPHFFASDKHLAHMERALQRHASGEAPVFFLLLQSVTRQEETLMSLSYLPPNGLAVSEWDDTDAAFRSCLQEVFQFLELPYNDPCFELPQKRAWMLERLSQIYSDSLRSSWQRMAWSKLGLSENSATILNVSQRLLRCIDQDEYPLSPGTSIRQVFDDAKQELLILGRPGVGKSTLLLELAQSLLRRAENDEQAPLPVIVQLSSWTAKGLPIQTWLSEQISQTYSIPRWLSKRWMKKRQFLPLLDSLDEVDEMARSHCIAAIHAYRQEYPGMLVVCSRPAASDVSQLMLQNTIIVQPISQEQVDVLLAQVGQPLEALRQMLAENMALREITTTPLMLIVCMLAYYKTAAKHLPQEESQLPQQIWKDYVKRVIAQRESSAHYSLRQTREWLNRLAQQMQARHEPIFFLELLQPDWLPRKQRILYQLSCGLVLGLAGTLIGALIFGEFGALTGSVLGMLIGTLNRSIRPVEAFSWSWKRTRSALPGGLLLGLTGGLIATIVYGLLVWFSWFPDGPIIGLFYMMVIVLPIALPIALPTGVLGGLLGAVICGFSRKQPLEHSPDFAHTGIRRSVLNGLVGGLLGGLLGSLLGELPALLTIQTALVLPGSLVGLLIGALVFGLWAATQHLLLRLWLWQSKQFPWKIRTFLKDSLNCILQYSGGGYSFIHRHLFDYLARLDTPEEPSTATYVHSTGTFDVL